MTVDGIPGAALSVMSQGELHALGLALFLPRANRRGQPVPVRGDRRPGAVDGPGKGRRAGPAAVAQVAPTGR